MILFPFGIIKISSLVTDLKTIENIIYNATANNIDTIVANLSEIIRLSKTNIAPALPIDKIEDIKGNPNILRAFGSLPTCFKTKYTFNVDAHT